MDEFPEEQNIAVVLPRRSLRLALSEINEISSEEAQNTPNKSASPEEILILQRGPRCKPVTWSPVEYDRIKILGRTRDKTPERKDGAPKKSDINPKLRRRLIMSPLKSPSQDLGQAIAKKLRSLKNLEKSLKLFFPFLGRMLAYVIYTLQIAVGIYFLFKLPRVVLS